MCSVFVPFAGVAFGQMWTVLSAALPARVFPDGGVRGDLAEQKRRVIVIAHVRDLERVDGRYPVVRISGTFSLGPTPTWDDRMVGQQQR